MVLDGDASKGFIMQKNESFPPFKLDKYTRGSNMG